MMDETVDLQTLARSGPTKNVSCATCGKPTSSHTITIANGQACELEERPLETENISADDSVIFAILCHQCFETYDLPTNRDAFDRLIGDIRGLSFHGYIRTGAQR